MVKYQRPHNTTTTTYLKLQKKGGGDEEQQLLQHHQPQPRLFRLLLLFSLVSFSLLAASCLLFCSPSSPFSDQQEQEQNTNHHLDLPCSSMEANTICCDRTTTFRSDVCFMKGDIRTRPSSSSIHLYNNKNATAVTEKIRPYTRKWETSVMSTIDELTLVPTTSPADETSHRCDVRHSVPAVVFSTGGYTGNVYHEFNDGILPLYITSKHFNKQVVFVILEYHDWWVTKYGDILSHLSDYPPIDISGDNRTHCFPETIVGLRIHDELSINPSQMKDNTTIFDFRRLLDEAYTPRIRSIEKEENQTQVTKTEDESEPEPNIMEKPKLTIISRNGSRGIDNEKDLIALCSEIGFSVTVLRPEKTTELAKIYRTLNDSDAMIGVHGAAMTHLLFMRPKSVFIQVVPLGTDWAAETYYGEPARKMGLKYVGYKILPKESSLWEKYARDDPVLRDPSSVTAKGWRVTKEVYLDGQSVRLDLNRMLKRLTRAYQYSVSRKNRMDLHWNWSWQQPPSSLQQQQQHPRLEARI